MTNTTNTSDAKIMENNLNKSDKPLISIIVPVYNSAAYLKRCVESLIRQTYDNIEILLVDDGSDDEVTSVMCDNLASRDIRIHVFHKKNGGTSSSRNYGMSMAKGEYFGFIDSDDYVEPWMYEKLIYAALKENASMVQIGRDEVSPDGNRLPDICTPPDIAEEIHPLTFLRELLLHKGDCSFCTKLVKADFINGFSFPEGRLNEDFLLCVQMMPDLHALISLPGYGYHVCYRSGSNTRTIGRNSFSRVFIDIVDNSDYALSMVDTYYPELHEEAVRFCLYQRLEYLLHIPVGMMRGDNDFYCNVVKYLKNHLSDILHNPYLTLKNRQYLLIMAFFPKTARTLHKKIKKL